MEGLENQRPRNPCVAALLVLAAMLLGTAGQAQLPTPGRNAIAASLVAESPVVVPGGTVTLALMMKPDAGWHGYWKNPGDSGVETQIAWNMPSGFSAGPIQYPVPERLVIAGLMNYVYQGDYAQLIDVRVPAGIAHGTKLPLRARIDYLACTDQICVPEMANVAIDLHAGAAPAARANRAMFDGFRQALPKPLGGEARFERAGNHFRLAIPLPAAQALDEPYFYPLTDSALAYAATQTVSRAGDTLIVETEAPENGANLDMVEGVLKLSEGLGLSLRAAPGAVPAAGEPVEPAREQAAPEATAILAALLGAVVGGLLLNIMPCVFPILSLKALSLAKAGGEEVAAKREALAYTGGAVLICLALGGALLVLRAGGVAAGWAFQLQDPRVIFSLLLLVTAIALNLAGLFELPAIAGGGRVAGRGGGASGAFWTGALAAFVATPCTGPFMGAALGAALVLPTSVALAIFAGLGLGLALPFLLLGFVPALRRRLPQPGAWMERLRRLLSAPMFLTALALAWILGRQAGVDGMALGLAAAMLVAFALWWVGRRQGQPRAWLPLAPAVLAAVAAMVLIPTAASSPAMARATGVLKSESFSETRLAALQQEQRPVFVYFTADWCVTCKVNEKGALAREQVADAFAEREVAVLVGDWTRGDAAIGRFLAKHGRSGVPLYLYYEPGKPVEILPQVLTPSRLVSMLR